MLKITAIGNLTNEVELKMNETTGKPYAILRIASDRRYKDKNGNKRTAFEIVADEVSFCGSKAETGTGNNNYNQSYSAPAQPAAPSFSTGSDGDFEEISGDDDLPF